MDKLIIEGGNRLFGEINVQGAKNSVLPILAASVLTKGECVIHNCPDLTDVDAAIRILRCIGCSVTFENHTVTVNSIGASSDEIPENLMQEMRSSIIFLAPLLSRFKSALLYTPGGCEIGVRPIDLHLSAMRKMGATIEEKHGRLICRALKLRGEKITLSFPSVGATENIIIAAVTAEGTTVINNAAREPEIADLAEFLNKCGAKISGAGESTVIIEGVKEIGCTEFNIMPDRIMGATYMSAAAITGGELILNNINPRHLEAVTPVFELAGCKIRENANEIYIKAPEKLSGISTVKTLPYPGFPTDAQAPVMAMTTVAQTPSIFIENIFESRFKHITELMKMGADIKVEGRVAIVEGVKRLSSANVTAPDLRGGAALVIAALNADGMTKISGVEHIDRGCDSIERVLSSIGAKIFRKECDKAKDVRRS